MLLEFSEAMQTDLISFFINACWNKSENEFAEAFKLGWLKYG